jgi:hypothetical protein
MIFIYKDMTILRQIKDTIILAEWQAAGRGRLPQSPAEEAEARRRLVTDSTAVGQEQTFRE